MTIVGAGIISVGLSQQSLIISAPASTGISQSMYATGNTTQSSSGTGSIGSLLVQGAGNVSVGVSNGSLVISGGIAGAGAAPGMSTFGEYGGYDWDLQFWDLRFGGIRADLSIPVDQYERRHGIYSGTCDIEFIGDGNASISVNGSTISIGANAAAISLSGNSTSAGAGFGCVLWESDSGRWK